MKLGIQTWGSDGDIFPFVALAGEMASRGHDVTLAITSAEHKDYAPYGERLGFRLVQVGTIFKNDEDAVRIGTAMFQAPNPFAQLGLIFEQMLDPCVDSLFEAARELVAQNDVVAGHAIVHPLQLAAEMSNRPHVTVMLQQGILPTRHSGPSGMPSLGRVGNALLWRLSLALLNSKILPSINRLRAREQRPAAKSFLEAWESRRANLIAIGSAFCRAMPDWGPHNHVTGFFRLPEIARPWQMPEDLARFLAAGPPPVYMTFGSMMSTQPDAREVTATTRMLTEAAAHAPCRAIIQSKWEMADLPEQPNVFRIQEAPHAAIFPHCAAVVHHGGAGTTQSATLAGLPSVIVAHASDQFFWGQDLERLGVAPKLIPRRSLTTAKLARAIRVVLDTPAMTERAARLGEALRAEDGVGNAAAILERTTF